MAHEGNRTRFGVFEVEYESGTLSKHGIKVRLQEQPFRVLQLLLERPGEVVTRDECQRRLWPDTTVDFERGLNRAISRLRVALGDDPETPVYIETVPQRGYRFLAPVQPSRAPTQSVPPDVISPIPSTEQAAEKDAAFVTRPGFGRRQMVGGLALGGFGFMLAGLSSFKLRSSSSAAIRTVAVLPLENLSGDPQQEYFSDGMTDELIGELARIGSLRVISRTSSMKYKGARKSLPEIARELGADAILEGAVTRSGDKIRISAQLIRATDEQHIWSAKYEPQMSDLLRTQSDVARAIASEIQIRLPPMEQSLARSRTVSPVAYDAFLKGTYFLYKGASGISRSIEYFREAIKQDPKHAQSHAGLAEALVFAGIFGMWPSAKALTEARSSALEALALDGANASAHNVLGDVKKGLEWNLAGAEAEYRAAIRLNSSDVLTRLWYAECLARMNRFQDALSESARAISLDPVSALSHNNRAMLLFRARRFDEAIRASLAALDLDSSLTIALWWQGVSFAGKRNFANAIQALTALVASNPAPMFRGYLGFAFGRAGQRAKALDNLSALQSLAGQRFVSPIDFALVYAGLDDRDRAFEWLEKAYQTRETRIHELPSIYFDAFRGDDRYGNLMRRIGLPADP